MLFLEILGNVGVSVGKDTVPLKNLGQVICDSQSFTINMSSQPEVCMSGDTAAIERLVLV